MAKQLTSITDEQAESLSQVERLYLNGLTSLNETQAESLSKNVSHLIFTGLKFITDAQAETLRKVDLLKIPEDL